MRYLLTVAYDGTDFHGWQKQQPPGEEPLRTVQHVLEQAVRRVVREEVNVVGASRTDAGVHAKGQLAAFSAASEVPLDRLPRAVNSRLPDDVQVRDVRVVAESFSPITDCLSKGYSYRLAYPRREGDVQPLFDRHYTTWTAYTLDAARMNEAARELMGEHDFASFTRLHHGRDSTVRCIHDCTVLAPRPGRCVIEVCGNGFLYNMVRIIAGTLLEIGRGSLEPESITTIREARDRNAAGPTLSPHGLCLEWVKDGG